MLGSKGALYQLVNGPASKMGGWGGDLVRSINLESDEILPGWLLDFHHTISGNNYILTLAERVDPLDRFKPRNVYVTDDHGVIYRAQVRDDKQPLARELDNAKAFPGAVPFSEFIAEPQGNALTRFLSSFVVYATDCLCTCCYADKCFTTWQECGKGTAFFNCGCGGGCVWCCGCTNWCGDKNKAPQLCTGGN
ncbi:MAG TPA: hypothetical protein VE263_11715 [Candidatus Angelobacter sp.]|nr:hypothetical protein [Candidatus Angelobacter sp.]